MVSRSVNGGLGQKFGSNGCPVLSSVIWTEQQPGQSISEQSLDDSQGSPETPDDSPGESAEGCSEPMPDSSSEGLEDDSREDESSEELSEDEDSKELIGDDETITLSLDSLDDPPVGVG